jgi:CheY-specific phosphatase CheX
MNTVTADSFAGLASMALERMAFVTAQPIDETAGEVLVHSVAQAFIEATGSDKYTLCLAATAGLVKEVASGMLGMDPDDIDVDDHGRATVSELANILGGELIMLVTGGDAQMSLGLPQDLGEERMGKCIDLAAANGFSCVIASESGKLLIVVNRG